MKRNVFQIGANALANSSGTPIEMEQVITILRTGDGPGHLVRALFEDCSLDSLDEMAAAAGMSPRELRFAYAAAREKHRACNREIEDASP